MSRVLFVSNGHGEAAIANRIAAELRELAPGAVLDHLSLVGDAAFDSLREVGPRRSMPSGGLIAMGNVSNLLRDLGAGLATLTIAQIRFLRRARGAYAAAVAVGDAYALGMTLLARTPTAFVGTAKSVAVAKYGPFERTLLRRAERIFVRDEATANELREHGLAVEPAANMIVDLFTRGGNASDAPAVEGFAPLLALLPGSRENAYADGGFLLRAVRALAAREPALGAVLSIAPGLSPQRFAQSARDAGFDVGAGTDGGSFVARDGGRDVVRTWDGDLGPLFARATLVLGQAGTANEAAAAAGIPIVAFARSGRRKTDWYRRRQQGLLGDALAIVPDSLGDAVDAIDALLRDPARRVQMGAAGRAAMGEPGAARRIAQCIAQLESRT